MKISAADIANAIHDSDKVEVSKDKKKVRRTGNTPLPEKNKDTNGKKRDVKANDKSSKAAAKEESKEEEEEDVYYDSKGYAILVEADF